MPATKTANGWTVEFRDTNDPIKVPTSMLASLHKLPVDHVLNEHGTTVEEAVEEAARALYRAHFGSPAGRL